MPAKTQIEGSKQKLVMTISRTLRIFLSSTFLDFGEERDLLVKRVFPALRARLKDRFVELVDVDLRWGITAEEAERGEVLPICLAEIDRSRPYFIGMLGERYGWVPPPDGYAPDLLERQPWLKKHQGSKSVTELEILHGVLKNKRMKSRAFFYFRSPAYARSKGGHYVPDTTEDRQRQRDLKRRIKDSGYSVTGYRDPEALAKRIERDLWKLIDAEYPVTDVPDMFERESIRHEAYAAPRRRLYLGGGRYRALLASVLDSDEQRIVIEGASGGGKSALLANFFEDYRKRRRKHLVHEHYLGASADAASPHVLVRRLLEFIQRTTGSSEAIPGDPQKLMESMPLWLATASAWARKRRTRFIFVLDSLNSLTDQQDLRWWPAFLPRGVTMVVSCLPGAVLDALKGKTEGLPGQDAPPKWKVITVRPLTKAQSADLLNTYLNRFNKKLSTPMVKQVQAHPLATNPLFVRTLAEELRLYGVHEELQKRLDHYLTSRTIDDLFERVLERVENDFGKKQVKAAMTAIWASRAGLTEKEILSITGLLPAKWAPIRLSLDEALLESNGHITFAHDYVKIATQERYLQTAKAHNEAHRRLGKWFKQQPLDARRAEEEPYQWEASGDIRALVRSLTDKKMFVFLFGERVDELRKYWVGIAATAGRITAPTTYARAWRRWRRFSDDEDNGAIEAYLSLFLVYIGYMEQFTETLARESLRKAMDAFGETSRVVGLRRGDLATLLQYRGLYEEAEELFRTNISSGCFAKNNRDRAKNLVNLGLLLKQTGDLNAAKHAYESAEDILNNTNSSPALQDLARIQNNIAAILAQQGEPLRAASVYRSALEKLIKLYGQNSQEAGIIYSNLASTLLDAGKYLDAEKLLSPALANAMTTMGSAHHDTAHIANNLASARCYLGDFVGALGPASLAFEGNKASIGLANSQTLISVLNLASILVKVNQSDEAAKILSEVLIEAEHLWALPNASLVPIISHAANMLSRLGRKEIAIRILKRFLDAPGGLKFKTVAELHDAMSRK